METEKRKGCGCTNCDHSCYKTSGPSGVLRTHVSRDEARRRIRKLKESLAKGEQRERA